MHFTTNIDRDGFFFLVVCIVAFFLMLAFALIFFVLYYNKKRTQFLTEKNLVQVQFQKTLLQSQLEMQEQTFNIISQEIHDNVGQILSLAKVQLNIIDQQETISKATITDVKENISKAMMDLRDIAKSLSTDRIQALELKELIDTEISRINRSGVFQTQLYLKGIEKQINPQKKLILFRIIQECLQNILKHAQATSIVIVLKYEEQELHVFIYDNGKGFDTTQIKGNTKGLGLQNMYRRSQLIQGRAEIESSVGNGTSITLTIPYEGA